MILINIWEYSDYPRVEITDVDGNIFTGVVIDLTDREEKSDLEEQEDSIAIANNGQYLEFLQSEIAAIRRIE